MLQHQNAIVINFESLAPRRLGVNGRLMVNISRISAFYPPMLTLIAYLRSLFHPGKHAEHKITAGHWPFSVHFNQMAAQAISWLVILSVQASFQGYKTTSMVWIEISTLIYTVC